MAITTYTNFITALGDLVVSGVVTRKDAQPNNAETADLPLSFPRPLVNDEMPLTVDATGGWPVLRAELVIALEPIGQNITPDNQVACVALIDNVNTALRAGTATTLGLGRAPLNWNVRVSPSLIIGDRQYWAVIATVEGRG